MSYETISLPTRIDKDENLMAHFIFATAQMMVPDTDLVIWVKNHIQRQMIVNFISIIARERDSGAQYDFHKNLLSLDIRMVRPTNVWISHNPGGDDARRIMTAGMNTINIVL